MDISQSQGTACSNDEKAHHIKKIGIMGTPHSSGNRGVLALGSSLASLCIKHADADEVIFFLSSRTTEPFPFRHKGQTIQSKVVNYRLSPKSAMKQHLFFILCSSLLYRYLPIPGIRKWLTASVPWINAASQCDIIGDIRGGDSFSDIYGMRRFLLGFLPVWSVLLIKRDIVLFPQTFGPYTNRLARWLAIYIMKHSSTIIARDTKSLEVAEQLTSGKAVVHLSPDVAFSLEAIEPKEFVTEPPDSGAPDASSIGINVNGLMYNGGYTQNDMFGLKMNYQTFLVQLVNALLAEQNGDIWLVPHTFAPRGDVESDNEACMSLRMQIAEDKRHRVKVIISELDQYEVKAIIGQCGFFIGSRMHSCIAALSQAIPCIGVAYSRKFIGVFASVDVAHFVIDAREQDNKSGVSSCLDCYRKRETVRPLLAKEVAEAKTKHAKIFANL